MDKFEWDKHPLFIEDSELSNQARRQSLAKWESALLSDPDTPDWLKVQIRATRDLNEREALVMLDILEAVIQARFDVKMAAKAKNKKDRP